MEKGNFPANSSGYEWLDVIGKGSHSIIHKVKVLAGSSTGKLLALKEIDMEKLSNQRVRTIMDLTVQLNNINHENILDYKVSFTEGSSLYFGMEYMACGSVSLLIKKGFPGGIKKLPVVLTILKSLLQGIAYLHENNIFHRDIKGSNILVSGEGRIALGDFMLSAKLKKRQKNTTLAGSPCWMAPEILEGKEGYDNSVDIWALGITCIELCEGKPPYYDHNSMQAIVSIVKNDPPSLSGEESWSQPLQEFVRDCLQKDPKYRPSAQQLLQKYNYLWSKSKDGKYLLEQLNATEFGAASKAQPQQAVATAATNASEQFAQVPRFSSGKFSAKTSSSDDMATNPPLSRTEEKKSPKSGILWNFELPDNEG